MRQIFEKITNKVTDIRKMAGVILNNTNNN